MAHFTRWLMVGSVVASSVAGPAAEACWLTGCCGGAPRTTFYAPMAVAAPACPNPCNTCAPANPCATGACGTSFASTPTTFGQPTVAMMPVTPVTTFRPMFRGGLFSGTPTQSVTTTLPTTVAFAPATQQTVGFAPLATPAWNTAPYTSFRPVTVVPTNFAVPATFTTPVTVQAAPQQVVQFAPQAVTQATHFAPTTTMMPATTMPTTTFMPTTTVTPVPATTSAPGCNCQSSTSTGTTSQYFTPNSNNTVVSAAPITSGTPTNGGAVMTSGSTTTFGSTNLGSQGVIQAAPQPTPANQDNNVKPIEDPIKKSSTTTPGYEDPRNKTALMPLVDNSQVAESKSDNAPVVRSLNDLAPYNPVRMTSHVR
jgi:hypothetical protein